MPRSNLPAKSSTPRVVIDTNLFIRGLLGGKVTTPLIQAWKARQFQLVTSERLIAELLEVASRPKFSRYFTSDDVHELARSISKRAEIVAPTIHVALCRDPKDDIFLDAAIAGKVPYIVTGDNDLKDDAILKAKMYQEYGIQIVGVPEFLTILT